MKRCRYCGIELNRDDYFNREHVKICKNVTPEVRYIHSGIPQDEYPPLSANIKIKKEQTMEINNAIIESVEITSDDHGCLSAWLHLDFGVSGQGFGWYTLYLPIIYRVLEIADVTKWSQLAGKSIRVKRTWSHIEAIGHIVKDDWFSPKQEFEVSNTSNDPTTAIDAEITS